MQPLDERTVGDLGGESRDELRIGTLLRDLPQELDDLGRDRNACELERPLEYGEIRVQALRREQRATRRTADAHHPIDADFLIRDDASELLQVRELRFIRGGREDFEVF